MREQDARFLRGFVSLGFVILMERGKEIRAYLQTREGESDPLVFRDSSIAYTSHTLDRLYTFAAQVLQCPWN